jgi:HK97 family phage major capsid protein
VLGRLDAPLEAMQRSIDGMAGRERDRHGIMLDVLAERFGRIDRRLEETDKRVRSLFIDARQARGPQAPPLSPRQALWRTISANFLSLLHNKQRGTAGTNKSVADVIRERFESREKDLLLYAQRQFFEERTAVDPAATAVPQWAGELVGTTNYAGLLPLLVPASVFSQLTLRGLALGDISPAGIIRVPVRAPTPMLNGDFVQEGDPIPVRRLAFQHVAVGLHKLGVISAFTSELAEHSVPAIEATIREAIQRDTSVVLDTRLLDNQAISAIRPPGLLNGIAATPPTAGGGLDALLGDLSLLAVAIPYAAAFTLISSEATRLRAQLLAPAIATWSNWLTAAPGALPETRLIAIDAADFTSAEGSARFDLGQGVTVHMSDTPEPIGTAGPPNVVAAPTASVFQVDSIGLRYIQQVSWRLRAGGRCAFIDSIGW